MTKISQIPVAQLIQDNPIGLDLKIKDMQIAMSNQIPWMTHPFGRSEKQENKDGSTSPYVYAGNIQKNEYIEVFPDDEVTGMCFFDWTGETDYEEENHWFVSDVKIVFAVNLEKAFPTLVHRATMEIIRDVREFIEIHQRRWDLSGIELTVENVFDNYTRDPKDILVDMQPYLVFAANTQVRWSTLEDCGPSNLILAPSLCEKIASATDQEVADCIIEQDRESQICVLLNCGTDPDAAAFIAANNITDTVEITAINQWVLTVKGQVNSANPTGIDLWTSCILHWWPLSPTSLNAATGNIRNPSYPITWVNTPTHTSQGVQGNGTTQYCRFGVVPSTDLTYEDTNFCVYTRTNQQRNEMEMGAFSADFNELRCGTRYSSPASVLYWGYTRASELRYNNNDSKGFWAFERTGTTMNVYKDGLIDNTRTVGTPDALPAVELYGMAYNNNGMALEYSSKQYSVYGITKGLTPAQQLVLSEANYLYQLTVIAGGRL